MNVLNIITAKPHGVLFIFFKLVITFFYFSTNNTPTPLFPLELNNRYRKHTYVSIGKRPQTKKRVLTTWYIYKKLWNKENISYEYH